MRGAVVDVNASPGLAPHIWPYRGDARNVADAFLDMIFPGNDTGNIPVLAVAGDRGTGLVAKEVDAIFRATGSVPGLIIRDHTFLAGKRVETDFANWRSASRFVANDPKTNQLVTAVSLRRAYQYGMQFSLCNGAAILPQRRHGKQDQFRRGLEILTRANQGPFIVMSGDTVALEVLRDIDPSRIMLIASTENDEGVQAHVEAGNSAVGLSYIDGQSQLSLYISGQLAISLNATASSEPVKVDRLSRLQAKMFALGFASAAGVTQATISQGFHNARVVRPLPKDKP